MHKYLGLKTRSAVLGFKLEILIADNHNRTYIHCKEKLIQIFGAEKGSGVLGIH